VTATLYIVYCCRPTSVYMALIKNKQKYITLASRWKVCEKKLKQLKVRASKLGLFHTLTLRYVIVCYVCIGRPNLYLENVRVHALVQLFPTKYAKEPICICVAGTVIRYPLITCGRWNDRFCKADTPRARSVFWMQEWGCGTGCTDLKEHKSRAESVRFQRFSARQTGDLMACKV